MHLRPTKNSAFSFIHPCIYGTRNPSKSYTTHRLLLGTHTSGQAQDYPQIATVHIPKRDSGGVQARSRRLRRRARVIGGTYGARYMPQNPDLISTKAVTGEVLKPSSSFSASSPLPSFCLLNPLLSNSLLHVANASSPADVYTFPR